MILPNNDGLTGDEQFLQKDKLTKNGLVVIFLTTSFLDAQVLLDNNGDGAFSSLSFCKPLPFNLYLTQVLDEAGDEDLCCKERDEINYAEGEDFFVGKRRNQSKKTFQ